MKKLDRNGRTYRREMIALALSCVDIRQCQKCGYPTLSGYCCNHCGDRNPSKTVEQEQAWKAKYVKKVNL